MCPFHGFRLIFFFVASAPWSAASLDFIASYRCRFLLHPPQEGNVLPRKGNKHFQRALSSSSSTAKSVNTVSENKQNIMKVDKVHLPTDIPARCLLNRFKDLSFQLQMYPN